MNAAGAARTRPARETAPTVARECVPDLDVTFEEAQCTPSFLDAVLEHRFTFAGETHALGTPMNWLDNPSADVEWHILLHKFYFAPGLARRWVADGDPRDLQGLQRLIDGWIDTVPIGFIAADVTARRVQNWAYAWHLLSRHDATPADPAFTARLFASVTDQIDWLVEHLAPSRNHRTLGLHAILTAALVFAELPAAPRWRSFASAAMLENIRTDLLDDGVHCELASDYHHIVLRSYLLFVRHAPAAGAVIPEDVRDRLRQALDFALHVHRPDGIVPALSDSDARDWRELLSLGASLFARDDLAFVAGEGRCGRAPSRRSRAFRSSGYVVMRSRWRDGGAFRDARWLVFDAGPVGAGNHGHFDALAVEAYAHGRPLVVDPGRFTYCEKGPVNRRRAFRGSRAHNTVTVDGLEPGHFRDRHGRSKIVAPFPATRLLDVALGGEPIERVVGETTSPRHDARHRRHVWFVEERYWLVLDRLDAPSPHDYALRWQLTPRASGGTLQRLDGAALFGSDDLDLLVLQPDAEAVIEDAHVSSTYGLCEPAPRLCVTARGSAVRFLTVLSPRAGRSPALSVVPADAPDVGGRGVEIVHEAGADRWCWDRRRLCRSGPERAPGASGSVIWSEDHD